jgi:hypothetical protein
MNATLAPYAAQVGQSPIRLTLLEWPESTPLQLGRREAFTVVADEPAQPLERHVAAWRASLGHAYAEWAERLPGID